MGTTNLRESGQAELSAAVSEPELVETAGEILCFLGEYVVTSGKRIGASETVACGYWLLRFEVGDGALEASELRVDGSGFQPGVSLAATYWREQHALCARYEAEFSPPLGDRMGVVSAGVLEGDRCRGSGIPRRRICRVGGSAPTGMMAT